MQMTKNEIEHAVQVWPANAQAPLTRDEQILLMTTARERHAVNKERILQLLKEQNHGTRIK